jgi:ATP-binding cassette subfamily B multidrug efflux pump
VEAAARAVNAHRFIERLAGGYDTVVRERGATLSTGEKQLLSFARALAHDPRVLVLDEATSSVDTETEVLIQQALRTLLRGRTAIVIAHRLSTVQDVDEILVMHKGQIRERGRHRELLAQRGLYWKLYQLQYKEQELASGRTA